MRKFALPAIVGCIALMPCVASATTYAFDFTGTGASTPLTLTNDVMSVTITGSGDPGGFQVVPSFFPGQSGYVLYTPGVDGQQHETMTLSFNQAIQSFSSFFARNLAGGPSGDFVLTAYAGGVEVGSVSEPGAVVSVFPQGTISFSGSLFDTITLYDDTASDFAVASLSVDYEPGQQIDAPEPATLAVLGLGALALTLRRKRRAV